ncbi:hypothetical protein RFI_27381 [Reticulomyxa filosa]|uniref:Uncharacterized protein n=1 Tax=Reticulomyxa filosa TaxID=46433 RepID=X6M7N9_RETFI|nr:hypothetical protein RFI_27381 [Reticulomyxa filosa]|eukprot:ETO09998.1 hypothetical protein RFI_27381 [Reticulomyxa filosa]
MKPAKLTKQISKYEVREMMNLFKEFDFENEFVRGLQTVRANVPREEAVRLFRKMDVERKKKKIFLHIAYTPGTLPSSSDSGYVDKKTFLKWLKDETNHEEVTKLGQNIREGLQIGDSGDESHHYTEDEVNFLIEQYTYTDDSEMVLSPNPPSESDASPYVGKKIVKIDEKKPLVGTSNKAALTTAKPYDQSRDTEEERDIENELAQAKASQFRRVSRIAEGRKVIRNEDIANDKWTKEDIDDMQDEMKKELKRLANQTARTKHGKEDNNKCDCFDIKKKKKGE